MKFSQQLMTRFGVRVGIVGLLALPVGYGSFLVWQEWHFREHLVRPSPTVTTTMPAPVDALLDATAVAMVLGLTTQSTLLTSTEPLVLRASLVVSNGLSRALLADAKGARMYQVGERLPGGSVLRRVEPHQVVLWNKGREERLMLQPSTAPFLRRFVPPAAPQTPVISTRYLRPLSGPSE